MLSSLLWLLKLKGDPTMTTIESSEVSGYKLRRTVESFGVTELPWAVEFSGVNEPEWQWTSRLFTGANSRNLNFKYLRVGRAEVRGMTQRERGGGCKGAGPSETSWDAVAVRVGRGPPSIRKVAGVTGRSYPINWRRAPFRWTKDSSHNNFPCNQAMTWESLDL